MKNLNPLKVGSGMLVAASMLGSATVAEASWTEITITGCASDIAAADGTSPWILGCTSGTGGYGIYYLNQSVSPNVWENTNGAGISIGAWYNPVAANNYPVVVNSSDDIFFGTPGGSTIGSSAGRSITFSEKTGCASNISAGPLSDSSSSPAVWVIGCTAGTGGYVPDYWTGTAFTSATGAGTRISEAPDGTSTWMINSSNTVYEYNPSTSEFDSKGGSAIAIAAPSNSGSVPNAAYIINTSNKFQHYNGSGWTTDTTAPNAKRVSAGYNGTVWLVDTSGNVWYNESPPY